METLNDLSQDVIIGILLRLPVKNLARFKCVSKSWYSIITSRNFVYKHLGNKNDGCLIAHYATRPSEPSLAVLFPDETLVDSSYHAFGLPFSRAVLHGPCNGLFFVTFGEQDYALWNPTTKEYLDLPSPAFPGGFCWDECCGFGLDPVTNDDYKLIVIQRLEEEDCLLTKVHTLGTDSWKDLEGLDQCERLYENTCYTYLKGNYYWRGSKHDHTDVIVSFDMGKDTFQEIEVPSYPKPAVETLAVFCNDLIALLTFRTTEEHLDIWVLKECWTKQISIGPLPGVKRPIGCWKNGELLLQANTDRLLLWEPTKEIRDLGLQGTDYCMGVHVYKESLISIKDECEYRRHKEQQSHSE